MPKKNSSDRGVLDFRDLNLNTETVDWPIPRVDDLLFKVQKGIVYSILDAKSGFSQIMIHYLETRRLLAFSDGTRKLEWNCMPMGVKNAPMIFSQIMYYYYYFNFCNIYCD